MKQGIHITDLQLKAGSFKLSIPRLRLSPRAIVCIIGPNGSGKTTLLQCLVGLLKPATGTIIANKRMVTNNLRDLKAAIGYVPDDEDWLIRELCADEYLQLLARIYIEAGVTTPIQQQMRAIGQTLHFTSWEQPLASLSHGNKKKVQLIAALMHSPAIIVADEIRNGLDPLAIMATEHLLRQAAERGATVIVSSHDLSWGERIADDLIVLVDGNVRIHERKNKVLETYGNFENLFHEVVTDA